MSPSSPMSRPAKEGRANAFPQKKTEPTCVYDCIPRMPRPFAPSPSISHGVHRFQGHLEPLVARSFTRYRFRTQQHSRSRNCAAHPHHRPSSPISRRRGAAATSRARADWRHSSSASSRRSFVCFDLACASCQPDAGLSPCGETYIRRQATPIRRTRD